ncbi:hypothetical protein H072_435 [Dactylellina haptotyla CBS 200.50]|uniref:MARVEL domain-containing protein n=1 Tax=Dactylellina haptotyla (strain CBS 200.50) TaxID=1284197 RepID=S8ARN9_DACHA|nr:hypothetical protein H072_435 [Dactylellina haptotyla CBS 200.50]
MTASNVWPFIPFMALRGAQVFFAIIVLGLSGYVGGQAGSAWSPWFALVTAIFTLIGAGGLIAAFFVAPAFTAPIITLGIDAFLFLFWLISLGGFADQWGFVLSSSYCYGNICGSIKGNMAMIVFEFLLFLATLVFSAWWFYRERSGKSSAGANPEGGHASAGAIAGAPTTHGTYPMQQQTAPNPAPTEPVAFPQESQYQYPPQSPPPQQYTQSPPPPEGQQQYPEMPVPNQQGGYQQPYQQYPPQQH